MGHRRDMDTTKLESVCQAYSGSERLKTFSIIPNNMGLHFLLLQIRGEDSYARSLDEIASERIDAYLGVFDVEKQRFCLRVH